MKQTPHDALHSSEIGFMGTTFYPPSAQFQKARAKRNTQIDPPLGSDLELICSETDGTPQCGPIGCFASGFPGAVVAFDLQRCIGASSGLAAERFRLDFRA
jgi:hypothetical protein